MLRLAWALPFSLAGCATTGERPSACSTDGGQQFVGQMATGETGSAILKATHSTILRWAPPGAMLTMDYNPSRVTVRVGADQKITELNCG